MPHLPAHLVGLARRLEVRALILLLGAGAALWAFLFAADEVAEGETWNLDRRILLAFRVPGHPEDPVGPRVFEEAMRDVTALGGFTVLTLITVLTVAALLFYGQKRRALVFGAAVLLAEVSADVTKVLVGRDRPDIVSHGSYTYSHSFPSGHSALSAVTFFTLAAILASLTTKKRAKTFVFAVATLIVVAIGLSRIYLGVHWPSDVLAGWTLGAAWALAARVALGGLFKPNVPHREPTPSA